MYAIYSTPYLDKFQKCYYNILIIEPRPIGAIRPLLKLIQLPNLSGNCGSCQSMTECVYAFISIKDTSKLMELDELPQLFNELHSKEYNANTSFTKMIQHSNIKQSQKTLLCYIESSV
jgi:hypothetical protein